MDIIKMTRDLGQAIQEDERYLAMKEAEKVSNEDKALQDMIGKFNLDRLAINKEAQNPERDEAKLNELNESLKQQYEAIMLNESMKNYNLAGEKFENLMKRISAILVQSAGGEDPLTTDLKEEDCGGSCSTCSGCH